jgi:LmbE family N-acetylglucosaminyl deacetylase
VADGLLAVNRLIGSAPPAAAVGHASALVFAPHPDDEVLGCGGVIALKARAGARVQVVVMTDGRASHGSLIDPDELARIRRAEAEEAGRQLGLAKPYEFLDFQDHRLAESRDAARERVMELINRFDPAEIYVPSRRDGIADHDETNHVVRRAVAQIGAADHDETNRVVRSAVARLRRAVVLLEYPLWLWNGWPWTADSARRRSGLVGGALQVARDVAEIVLACRTRIDVGSVLERKRAALAVYRSQLERLNGDPRWPVLSDVAGGEFLRRFEGGVEIFRRTDYRP